MENELTFALGPVAIGTSVITTWGIMLVITLIAWLSTRRLDMLPGKLQTTVEGIVATIDEAITAVAPEHGTANPAFYCLALAVSDHCQSGRLNTGLAFADP